ncbi:MAG: head-tail adaptor protein [Devosia sp.]|nr:head-tail adaptor protein [Devosia sp.]
MADTARRHGAIRRRLHLQRRADGDDGFGNTISGAGKFETVGTVFASLTPRTGGEEVTAARLSGRQPYIVRVRNLPITRQITVAWQMVDTRNQGRVLAVTSPPADPNGKNQWLEFLVVEGRPS